MERTPSPPRRLHTPPAPLHHGGYEPYSPRRSNRVAARRDEEQQQSSSARPRQSRTTRDLTPTPTSSKKKPAARTSLQGLSPPSSPISPNKHRTPRSTRHTHFETGPFDSDSDHVAPTPATRFLSAMDPRGMLPTPAKTPRKRQLQSEEALSSTARVLFPNRPTTVEDAMPSPRKGRKSRKNVFSLESFAEQNDEGAEKIEIYTDSKERVPTADEDEDNPFLTKKGKGKARAKVNGPSKPRKTDPKTAKMQEAVDRDEGMVYLFRGKKIYRPFDGAPSNASEEAPESSGDELRRHAGSEARRPLTRSSIKPRLLFQEEIKQREREMGPDDVDEEAITDIEVPIATPSNRKTRKVVVEMSTPTIKRQEATPPPTVRPKREISFSSWTRVKSSSSRTGSKRGGDHLESNTEKRTRSEPSSAMSLD